MLKIAISVPQSRKLGQSLEHDLYGNRFPRKLIIEKLLYYLVATENLSSNQAKETATSNLRDQPDPKIKVKLRFKHEIN
jgi:hypothetical protein